MKMGCEEKRFLQGRVYSVGSRDTDGGYGVNGGDDGKIVCGESRVFSETQCGDLDSVVKAASMVYDMTNERLTKKDREMIYDVKRIAMNKTMGCGYEVGDMVWGKIKSYPWWPGQIFQEAFALACVNETKREDHVLVAFFGDNSYAWFDPIELIPFDSNYLEKSKQSNAKAFVDAVEEAEHEAGRRAALGLSCYCRNPSNIRPVGVKGFFTVDVGGYVPGAVYSRKQIQSARSGFQPVDILCFIQQLALMPSCDVQRSVDWIRSEAIVLAYRRAVFEEIDETYIQALRAQPLSAAKSVGVLDMLEKVPSQASLGCPPEIAEAPRIKSSVKPLRFKDQHKRDKSNIEQTDKLDVSRVHHTGQEQSSLTPSMCDAAPSPDLTGKGIRNIHKKPMLDSRTSPPLDSLFLVEVHSASSDSTDERRRVSKRPGGDLISEKAIITDKRKKKEGLKLESCLKHPYRSAKIEALARRSIENSCHTGLVMKQDMLINQPGKGSGARYICSKLIQLHHYLLAFALNPLCSVDDKVPVLQFFLLFRSLVYEKKTIVAHSAEVSTCAIADKSPLCGNAHDLPSASKPPKKRFKPDDYAKVGQNSSISYHGEEMSTKGHKELTEMKSISAEKKACSYNPLQSKGRDGDEVVVAVTKNLIQNSIKKHEAPTSAAQPTMLVMQFPRQSSLPSVSELKARFARFGPFHSTPRVFWKSSICQILFKCKSDAKAAFRYEFSNRSRFGNAKVNYCLQAIEVPAAELPKPGKQLMQDSVNEVPPFTSSTIGPRIQPKPCLKKVLGDQVQSTIGMSGEEPRVKFTLSGTKSSRGEQLAVGSEIEDANGNYLGGNTSYSHEIVDISGKNFQQVIPSPLPPHLPLPYQISDLFENYELNHLVEACDAQYRQVEARNSCIYTTRTSNSTDISNQMINLLTRCNEIVGDLKCWLGHVPLHL